MHCVCLFSLQKEKDNYLVFVTSHQVYAKSKALGLFRKLCSWGETVRGTKNCFSCFLHGESMNNFNS